MQEILSGSTTSCETVFEIEGQLYTGVLFSSPTEGHFPEIGGTSIFLSKAYHTALENAPPENMQFRYVRLEKDGALIGMLCFQISQFNPGESLKKHKKKNFINRLRYQIASLIQVDVLCLGNTLVTGDYGFCFKSDIPNKLRTLLMMKAIDWLMGMPEFRKVGLIFVKDYYRDIFEDIPGSLYCKKYHPIDTQPSMIMDIPPEWKGLAGYLDALKSKYRVRAKKAIQLAAHLERVELNADQIEEIEDILHSLYLKVVEDVGFNLFILREGYFSSLKRSLGDRFHLWVYKDKGEIISFFTVFEDGDILDAHFLGYDPEVNHHYKLYMNMLMAMIDFASSRGFRQLQLSRTATEIKSSVGAEGFPMWAYLRTPNRFVNTWLPRIYSFFKPDLSWIPRQPFRD